jgi:carbon starvation protein
VGIVALIAACSLEPADYFAINVPPAVFETLGMTPVNLAELSREVGEDVAGRTGGAVSLAVGFAQIFTALPGLQPFMSFWYHFAIMFEALFILTTLDAGTRVGRFMVQDLLGNVWEPLGRTSSLPANVLASALIVAGWGYFLYQGVVDPLGGINSLWPLFGIANQLLAATALAAATTIFIRSGRARFGLLTGLPLAWLLTVTMTAGWQKIFHAERRIGFLAQADFLAAEIAAGRIPADKIAETQHVIFNNRLDAAVTALFMTLVAIVVLDAARVWWRTLRSGATAAGAEALGA